MTQLTAQTLRANLKKRPLTTRIEVGGEVDDYAVMMFYIPVDNKVAEVIYRYVPGSTESGPRGRLYSVKVTWWDSSVEASICEHILLRWREISSHWLNDIATRVVSRGQRVNACTIISQLTRAEMTIREERRHPYQQTLDPDTLRLVLTTAEDRIHGLGTLLQRQVRIAEDCRKARRALRKTTPGR